MDASVTAVAGSTRAMNYDAYQAQQDFLAPFQAGARIYGDFLRGVQGFLPPFMRMPGMTAALDIFAGARTTHVRPPFGFDAVQMGERTVGIREEAVLSTPFGTLLRFRKDGDPVQPKVLVVAPLSGHFATLLRGTVATLLPDHDVYVTDWHNAREVPVSAGRFGFDECIEHVMRFLETMGGRAHVLAVCQPAPIVLAAAALMAEDGNPATPASLTLMAGPIDTRVNPTRVNELATSKPIAWFERELISRVPLRYAGAGRPVYPGAVQVAAFMSMNMERHRQAYSDQFRNLVTGDTGKAETHRRFYDEYLAVMDLPAEFYLETVRLIFQEHALATGTMTWRGRPVRPAAIRDTRVLTVEAERDDICAVGQTAAALDLCTGLPDGMKRHHLQGGVGHYGVFNGRRWATEIYPVVRETIAAAEEALAPRPA